MRLLRRTLRVLLAMTHAGLSLRGVRFFARRSNLMTIGQIFEKPIFLEDINNNFNIMTTTTFTHVDESGKARMVNIKDKLVQKRYAKAQGKILLGKNTLQLIAENQIQKGDVLAVAQIAGIQAAKITSQLIPLCHQLPLEQVAIDFEAAKDGIIATSEVYCTARTGAEMEALVAVNAALLAIYDMCKAVDKNMVMTNIKLIEKKKHD